jgi:chromatin remodeling complex protein RSC6
VSRATFTAIRGIGKREVRHRLRPSPGPRRQIVDSRWEIVLNEAIAGAVEARRTGENNNMAKKANAAFMKPLTPSEDLAKVVGDKPLPRTEVVKKLWAYIKKNDLQDKKNRRNINADANLKVVFGGKVTVNMFEMTKLVSKHLK